MASDRTCLQIERRVGTFVAERELLKHGQKALLMLSGGADSMALLALVRRCDRALGLGLTFHALHVDYATRGADSAHASCRDRTSRSAPGSCATGRRRRSSWLRASI